MENGMFWSEIGSGFREPGGTLPPRIPRNIPHPHPLGVQPQLMNDHRRKLRVSGKQNLLTYEQSFGNSEQDNLSFHELNSFTVSISSK